MIKNSHAFILAIIGTLLIASSFLFKSNPISKLNGPTPKPNDPISKPIKPLNSEEEIVVNTSSPFYITSDYKAYISTNKNGFFQNEFPRGRASGVSRGMSPVS